jgi:tight adherence protein B
MIVFVLVALSSACAFGLLVSYLDRREAAQRVKRLAQASKPQVEKKAERPLLIQAADEMRGRLTAGLLRKLRLDLEAERILERAALKWRASGMLHRSIGLFLAGFAGVTFLTKNQMPWLAIAAGLPLAMLPVWYVKRRARNRVHEFEEQFPDCLEFISRSMRAGHGFSVALEMAQREFADPLGAEFRRAFEEQNLGQALEVVLNKLAQRVPSMDVQFFVSAVLLQKRTGGNLAELLDKLAQIIRERFKLRARIRAVSAQGLMSGRILAAIPMGVSAMMFLVNPSYAKFFIVDPTGHLLLAGAVGLQCVGYLIIRKIVNIEV